MPLYNQATNLQGRGNFAPGVTYYAGIKAPRPADITLPKATGGFNIDLSRIGDAMIAAKESETKLGLAAVEMEENMRNAEKERQLKLDLANMEDARLREMQDKDLAMKWNIASMQNNTELQKMKLSKQASEKDYSKNIAVNSLINDPELQQAYIDYSNNSPEMNEMNLRKLLMRKVGEITAASGGHVSANDLLTAAKSAGYMPIANTPGEISVDITKTQQKQQIVEDTALGKTFYPNATEEEANVYGNQIRQTLNNIDYYRRIAADPNSLPMEKDMATRLMTNNLNEFGAASLPLTISNVVENLPKQSNPNLYINASKEAATQSLALLSGDYYSAKNTVDGLFKYYGVDRTLKNINDIAQTNAQYSQNILNTTINESKQGLMNDEVARGFLITPEYVMQNLDKLSPEYKDAVLEYLSKKFLGSVNEDIQNKQYMYKRGPIEVNFPEAAVNEYMNLYGYTTPYAAVLSMTADAQRNPETYILQNKMTPTQAANLQETVATAVTGTENPNWQNMSKEQLLKMTYNVVSSIEGGYYSPEAGERFAKANKIELNSVYATAALAKLSRMSERDLLRFYGLLESMNPVNFSAREVYEMTKSDKDPDFKTWAKEHPYMSQLSLKDTQMFFRVYPDGGVAVDYAPRGPIGGAGNKARQAASKMLTKIMMEYGLSQEEQVALLKKKYPNIATASTVQRGWLNSEKWDSAKNWISDLTLSTPFEAETRFISWATEDSKPFVAEEKETDRIKMEQAFENFMNEERTQTQPGEEPVIETVNESGSNILISGITNRTPLSDGTDAVVINNKVYIVPSGKSNDEVLEDYEAGRLHSTEEYLSGELIGVTE